MSIKPTNIPKCHLRKSADSAGNISRHCKLGEVTENIRTFALPFDDHSYTFKMQYQYDSYNRIQRMTYPDGEVVSYGYNRGGMLESVLGNKNGVSSDYIKEIRYNKYELKDSVSYGNGTSVRYLYDSLLRLSHLRSECADGVMQDIDYDYDSVSNITNIANSAPMMPNGLGGTYSQSFSYDNMYRLMGSSGIWAGSDSLDYHTETEYHANGRIKQKQVTAKVLSNGHVSQISYDNGYYYDNLQQPNTLSRISAPEVVIPGISFRNGNDRSSSPVVHFSWDATGNMVSQDPAGDAGRRFLCWDEQNRLQGVVDGKHLSYYLYDANGDRAFKLTGKGDLQNISGTWQYYYLLENATLYASPYLVATDKGYTKHYYAESERITSKIGGGGLTEFGHPLLRKESFVNKMKANSTMMDKVLVGCLNAKYYEVKPVLQHLYDWQDSVQPEDNCYWYHPDHLGSSSWITYTDGSAVQHLHYLPWGEDFVDQRNTSWNAMYTFSAKEKDTETGYSYFGSRYYNSDLSIWLSVDPMASKYPSLSPYVYCADNPVKLVDPNGKAWKPTINEYTGECTGYEWIKPEDSYESDGKTLKEGLYKEAIFFSDNGTYNPKNRKNIGSSTATVYKADGSKKIFQACTNPSDASKYATVPGGTYIARMGMHVGHNTRYMALKLQGKIELGMENPAYNDHRTYATGIDIHMPGEDNLTGMTRSGSAISEGCLLIDGFEWNNFMDCFSPETDISVTVSRTMSAPTNMNVNNILPSILLPQYPLCPPDKTRTNTVCPIF